MKLSNTAAFDYPTINALANHILELQVTKPQQKSTHIAPLPDRALASSEG